MGIMPNPSWDMGRYYSRWSTGQLPRHRKISAGLKSHAIWIMQKNPWKSSLTRFLMHVKMSNPPWSAVPFNNSFTLKRKKWYKSIQIRVFKVKRMSAPLSQYHMALAAARKVLHLSTVGSMNPKNGLGASENLQ